MDEHFFDERPLLDIKNNDIAKEQDLEDVEYEGIHVAIWEKQNALLVVPQEHTLEVLCQQYYSQVAGNCRI